MKKTFSQIMMIFLFSSSTYANEMQVFDPPTNIRDKPDGEIVCTIKEVKKIEVSELKDDWYSTSACGSIGVIHKSQVKKPDTNDKKADKSNDVIKSLMEAPILSLIQMVEQERKESGDNSEIAPVEFLIAKRFREGVGTEKDLEKAFTWYEKSANDGDVDAKLAVGGAYLFGEGVKQNTDKGLDIIMDLALKGNEKALKVLKMINEMAKEKK